MVLGGCSGRKRFQWAQTALLDCGISFGSHGFGRRTQAPPDLLDLHEIFSAQMKFTVHKHHCETLRTGEGDLLFLVCLTVAGNEAKSILECECEFRRIKLPVPLLQEKQTVLFGSQNRPFGEAPKIVFGGKNTFVSRCDGQSDSSSVFEHSRYRLPIFALTLHIWSL